MDKSKELINCGGALQSLVQVPNDAEDFLIAFVIKGMR